MEMHGVRLRGLIDYRGRPGPKGGRKVGARIIWVDGRLYVAKTPTDVVVFDCPDKPTKQGGGYRARIGDATLQILRPGCSCQIDEELRAIPAEDLIAQVEGAGV